jgi:CRISPR system Cascade subunit CasE
MFLSLLYPNARNADARKDMRRPYELHRTLITRVFMGNNDNMPRGGVHKDDVLFRLESEPVPAVLVQSRTRPDWSALENWRDAYSQPYVRQEVLCKSLDITLTAGQRLAFRLCASPTKRVGNSAQDKSKIGDRIAIYGEEEQLAWLARKFEGCKVPNGRIEHDGGLRLLHATVSREERHKQIIHNGAHALSFFRVQFDGILEVAYPELAMKTVQVGIGASKGNGCGLLSLAPISPPF